MVHSVEVDEMVTRRKFVQAAGGVGLALVGAGGLFAVTRTPYRARRAWTDIEGAPPADVRLEAFRHGILAPNPHNRQPWMIRLVGDDQAVITCDLDRRLPETDPFDRQILIGFGCFLELARMAAAERGVRMDINAFPEGSPGDRLDRRPIANVRFVRDQATERDPLFSVIPARRSTKQAFDVARTVAQTALDTVTAKQAANVTVRATIDPSMVQRLRIQTWDAWLIELKTQRTWMESVNLMRIGKTEIEANPDGISLGGPMLEALSLMGQLSRAQMAQPGTTVYESGIARYRQMMETSMAFTWIVTDGNSRADQLATGRAYVRMNLEATRTGLGFHPISQGLQEYPEMKPTCDTLHTTLGAKVGQRVQMLVRLGYGGAVATTTPRWPLENKLTRA
jgi:hypothetical protein